MLYLIFSTQNNSITTTMSSPRSPTTPAPAAALQAASSPAGPITDSMDNAGPATNNTPVVNPPARHPLHNLRLIVHPVVADRHPLHNIRFVVRPDPQTRLAQRLANIRTHLRGTAAHSRTSFRDKAVHRVQSRIFRRKRPGATQVIFFFKL